MRIVHLAQSDCLGGAARASWRLHQALKKSGEDSRILVRNKASDDPKVIGPRTPTEKLLTPLRFKFGKVVSRLLGANSGEFHSWNWLPSKWAKRVKKMLPDLVHLHWVGGETLSIRDIGRIAGPRFWTLHDMWPFCASEHFAPDFDKAPWKTSYDRKNQKMERSPWYERWVYSRKRNSWKPPFHLIAVSQWLADCVSHSSLMRTWPVRVIPNLLDTEVFKPLDQTFCRQALGIPDKVGVVLFGAQGGTKDPRKGWDLLVDALGNLRSRIPTSCPVICLAFGQSQPEKALNLPFPVKWLGHLSDDIALVLAYNAADVVAVPSRQETFGQTASEAQACGRPVVAFDGTGLRDVVGHETTGYLAPCFDTKDFAFGLSRFVLPNERIPSIREAARQRALRLWSPGAVIPQIMDYYLEGLEASCCSQ